MQHQPYTLDSITKSNQLSSSILSSDTPPQITSTCNSILSFIRSTTPDHSRHFFSLTFPTLISKFFGFNNPNSTNGWIHTLAASNDTALAATLFSLFSPNGALAAAISAVDRLSLVKYVFPSERLPEWTQAYSNSSSSLSNLIPSLFKGKINEDSTNKSSGFQIQLNVFEYFFFWFAYYPVCRGKSESLNEQVSVKRTKKFTLENWTCSIPGFSNPKRGSVENKTECDLYSRLLYAYLRAYVPNYDLSAHQPYRSSILHYGSGYDASVVAKAEFVVNALTHFWLVDNDFSPLPVNLCKSAGASFPLRGEIPPAPGLGEVVKLFVRYLNLSTVIVFQGGDNGGDGEYCESPRWRGVKDLGYNSVRPGYWNPWVQRPLYRFLLRSFLFCPVAASVKNVSQVFSVWISYMEPWTISGDDFAELDAMNDGPNEQKENSVSGNGGFTPHWQDYLLSNYLYYSSLVMHFIGFAHKFLHSDVEIIVQMVLKVLDTLTSSKELIDLLKNVDTVFHSKQAGSGKSTSNNLYRYVPIIREQLQDWEDGLCETDADGSFLHDNWNKDLQLFADGENGGQQLIQLFILRAEAELQSTSGDNLTPTLQCIDSLKAKLACLFDGQTIKSSSPTSELMRHQQSRDDIFKPRRVGNHAFTDVKYKGDWIRRPISNDEIAWLAKVLIRLSDWLNESLKLNQPASTEVSSKCSYVEVPTDVTHICGPTEPLKVFFCAISSWFLFLGAATLSFMRKYGLRVNLRILASKKVVMVLVFYSVFCILKKLVRAFHII
ncbi:hypothetical protein TanjilG_28109 [Lupinus angustifolius]|uniref:Sphingomyelin phosphodiesterase n=1 Tax=Lupinus angustifolius TaxID=3871 RepID=A0A4P1RGQ1_LUPAN|nr:PREDICTED: uncharacterized protein LOC109349644 [Lupinus angustifolius]OIW10358.1 hypothetical protein TanjilG_28109 [Lupinus angustifolius]